MLKGKIRFVVVYHERSQTQGDDQDLVAHISANFSIEFGTFLGKGGMKYIILLLSHVIALSGLGCRLALVSKCWQTKAAESQAAWV